MNRTEILARADRCAKYDFDTVEMIECKWELWDDLLAALRASAAPEEGMVPGETITVKIPEGYDTAWDFLNDCGLEAVYPSALPSDSGKAAPVQDTYLIGGRDLRAMSGSVESDRVVQLHFKRRATDEDRKWLLDAINEKIRSEQESALAPATEGGEIRQHIAWLFQYVQGMNPQNWRDMKLRAERQLEQLSLKFPGPAVPSARRDTP